MKTTPPNIIFVAPAPTAFSSGGNVYNKRLAEALQSKDWKVSFLTLDQFLKSDFGEEETVFLVDSLYQSTFVPKKKPNCRTALLCHLLTAPLAGLDKFDMLISTGDFYLKSLSEKHARVFKVEPILELPNLARNSSSGSFVMSASFEQIKGVLPFLQALPAALATSGKEEREGFKLEIYGSAHAEPHYFEHIQRQVSESPLLKNCVSLLRPLSYDRYIEVLSTSRGLVSASQMESFGMAVREAQMLGKPIFALKSGNLAYLQDASSRISFAGSAESLARTILSAPAIQSTLKFNQKLTDRHRKAHILSIAEPLLRSRIWN